MAHMLLSVFPYIESWKMAVHHADRQIWTTSQQTFVGMWFIPVWFLASTLSFVSRINHCFAPLVVTLKKGLNNQAESVPGIRNGWLGTAKLDGILAIQNENVVFLRHLLGCLGCQLTQTNLVLLFLELVSALDTQKITLVSCGRAHSMAVNDQGQVFAWGAGGGGQLGLGTAEAAVRIPRWSRGPLKKGELYRVLNT